MNQLIKGVKISKICSIKPDGDSKESKQITLNFSFDGTPLQGVFDKAVNSAVINWQGANRKNYDNLKNGQVIEVQFKAPGRQTVDGKTALINEARAAGIDVTDKKALIAFIEGKL